MAGAGLLATYSYRNQRECDNNGSNHHFKTNHSEMNRGRPCGGTMPAICTSCWGGYRTTFSTVSFYARGDLDAVARFTWDIKDRECESEFLGCVALGRIS